MSQVLSNVSLSNSVWYKVLTGPSGSLTLTQPPSASFYSQVQVEVPATRQQAYALRVGDMTSNITVSLLPNSNMQLSTQSQTFAPVTVPSAYLVTGTNTIALNRTPTALSCYLNNSNIIRTTTGLPASFSNGVVTATASNNNAFAALTYQSSQTIESPTTFTRPVTTGPLTVSGSNIRLFPGADPNQGVTVIGRGQDGATFTVYNGGLRSWNGLGFECATDGVTRFVHNTRTGDTSIAGDLNIRNINSSNVIWTSNAATFGSNTAVTANSTATAANTLAGTANTTANSATTTATWASNASFFSSNAATFGSNTSVTAANTANAANSLANAAFNNANFASSTAVAASNNSFLAPRSTIALTRGANTYDWIINDDGSLGHRINTATMTAMTPSGNMEISGPLRTFSTVRVGASAPNTATLSVAGDVGATTGVRVGTIGGKITNLFAFSVNVGTSSAVSKTISVSLGATMSSTNYQVSVSFDQPTGTFYDVFGFRISNRSTTAFDLVTRRLDGGNWGANVTAHCLVWDYTLS